MPHFVFTNPIAACVPIIDGVIALAGQLNSRADESATDSMKIESWFSVNWSIPPSLMFLLAVFCVALIVMMYRRERGRADWRVRSALVVLRLLLLGLILLAMLDWQRNTATMEKPQLLVVIDTSASMDVVDRYTDSETNDIVRQLLANADSVNVEIAKQRASKQSRLQIAKTLLTSGTRTHRIAKQKTGWLDTLNDTYRVRTYRIDESLRLIPNSQKDLEASDGSDISHNGIDELKPDGSASRLGDGLIELIKQQRGRPTAAILILSDGINTTGQSLDEAADFARQKLIPLHVVGIGDASPPQDIRLGELLVEDAVFVDDMVTVTLNVHATGYAGEAIRLDLRTNGDSEVITSTTIQPGDSAQANRQDSEQVAQARLMFRPEDTGDLQIEVSTAVRENEIVADNNRSRRTIRVKDETIRVLLVADYPNREFHYLKQVLARSLQRNGRPDLKAIELKTLLQQGDLQYASTDSTAIRVFPVRDDQLFEFDVIILCDARVGDATGTGAIGRRDLERIRDFVSAKGKGLVVIAGPSNPLRNYGGSAAEHLLPIAIDRVVAPDANADLTESFRLGITPAGKQWSPLQIADRTAQTSRLFAELPGFYWLAEATSLRPGARVLAAHADRAGQDGVKLPVIAMQFVGAGKVVWHGSPETYRWRFRAGDVYFQRYWIQLIRYLSRTKLNEDNHSVRLKTDRETYQSADSITISAEFTDERVAPARDDGVRIQLQREDKTRQTVSLARNSVHRGYFETQVEDLAPGEYRVTLSEPVMPDSKPTTRFSVIAPQTEIAKLRVNEPELQSIAKTTGGRAYALKDVDRVLDALPSGHATQVSSQPPERLWQSWQYVVPFALLFTLLITVEWIIRKSQWML